MAAPGDQFAQADRRQALEPVIRQLPQRQRQVLWLRLLADFSEAETAEILGISAGSVKTHLNHAKNPDAETTAHGQRDLGGGNPVSIDDLLRDLARTLAACRTAPRGAARGLHPGMPPRR